MQNSLLTVIRPLPIVPNNEWWKPNHGRAKGVVMFTFNRGIDSRFIDRLNAEYERGGWWRAIASDPDLFIAIRDGYLNIYRNGSSLLKLTLDGDRLAGETHYKYLLRPDSRKPYVPVDGGVVKLPDAAALFHTDLSDMSALKRAAAAYVGDEKAGVHRIVLSNSNVVDVEVTFGVTGNGEEAPSTRRIDFAALHSVADGAEIVFYEAKAFANKELRAGSDTQPPVIGQIEGYRKLLVEHTDALARSYRAVCGNLVALDGVRERYGASLDLMRRLASNDAKLNVNEAVSLVVFGFDSDQRDGTVWKGHREKLEATLGKRLLLKGDPQGFTRGISTPV